MTGDKPNTPPILSPLSDEEWPLQLNDLKGGFATRLNVYRMMAHHPDLLAAWSDLRDHVVVQTSLGAEFSEVVILRTGVNLGSDYEWAHHVSRARALGMTDARLKSIKGDPEGMSPEDATLAHAVDALFENKRLPKDITTELVQLVGKEGMMDLMATVGFYSTLGYMLNSFQTPIDDDIAAELKTRPLP